MIKRITSENFRRYGRIIEYPDKKKAPPRKNLFRIVQREKVPLGWRIAYLVVRDRAIDRLEQHAETFESFEPVAGKSIIYVSTEKDIARIESFLLDKPVILKKGIWHGVVAVSGESDIKITENARVDMKYWKLGITLNSGK